MSTATSTPGVPDVSNDSTEDRLYTVKYEDHEDSHLGVKVPGICVERCSEAACQSVCPADVWEKTPGEPPTIAFENCLECGSCRFACPQNNVHWEYPENGTGVTYKFG